MATIPTSQSIALTCPSCGGDNLESWNQKIVVHPDRDDIHAGNPLKTRGEWLAITLHCSGCNTECYIATGNHKGVQQFGIFPGTPAEPEPDSGVRLQVANQGVVLKSRVVLT